MNKAFMPNNCVALMYHRIRPRLPGGRIYPNDVITVYVDEFDKQVAFLKKNFSVLSKNEFVECVEKGLIFPKKSVLITFDDGQTDIYEFAYPILKKHNVPAIVFLPTDFIGTNKVIWWDELESYLMGSSISGNEIALQMAKMQEEERRKWLDKIKLQYKTGDLILNRSALTWQEIKEMTDLISFQPHTKNHVRLSNVLQEEARNEILGSKQAIEENLGIVADVFAYPYGGISDYNETHELILTNNGFKLSFSTSEWHINKRSRVFALPRVAVNSSDNLFLFRIKLSWLPVLLKRAIRKIYNKCKK
ncbi:MAG: polysaccharide deacetylase family protein [Candidatus Saganbacteria bacterium]|nr:polysaccharide deacetylase family protein [Candidatus Saganbacteria bacterium]